MLPQIAEIVGSDAHRELVERAIRSRTGTIERLEFSPGDGSKTDMHGRVWVDSAPPFDGATAEETAICINGRARHELLHPMHTDRRVFDAFVRDELPLIRARDGEQAAQRLMMLWNCVEDGMIETREQRDYPGSYRWIAAMNQLDPRVGRSYTVGKEVQLPWQADYLPEDADGNALPCSDGLLTIPAGTTLTPWTDKPLSLPEQATSAILAEAVPGFTPGALHPRVQAFLDEARPYIEAARAADSAECVRCAYALHALLDQHDLLPEVVEQQGGLTAAGATGEASGSMAPVSAPEGLDFVPGDQQNGSGPGGAPSSPSMPPPPGQPKQSEQLQGTLGGGPADQQTDEQSGAGAGGENSASNKDTPQPADGEPAASGPESSGGSAAESPPQASSQGGEGDGQRSQPSELERAKQRAREELEGAAARERSNAQGEGRWQSGSGDQIRSASELRSGGDGEGQRQVEAIAADGQLRRLGHKLAAEFERIKEIADQDTRYLRTGNLDRRRMPAAIAGNPHVMKRRVQPSKLDVAVEVVLDRSGSIGEADTANQFRMATMFAEAAKRVPGLSLGIFGFDGSPGRANHYEYLPSGSEDQRALKSIFSSGGGGTPTPNAIEFALARLREQQATHKLLIVVTDGIASGNDGVERSREQVEWAERDGMKVIGFGFECDDQKMREQFGATYRPIDDYTQVPKIAGRLITRLLGKQR